MEGRAQRQKCCESFSMGVGEEESHSKHKTHKMTVSRRGHTETYGPCSDRWGPMQAGCWEKKRKEAD